MDAGDVDEPHRHDCSAVESSSRGESSKAGEVFQLSMLKNCLRRRRPLSTRSPIAQLMSWTFSKAAQTFLHRLQRCNGAQEEPVERSCKQPSGLNPLHDGQGGQGRGIESKTWDSEVRDSLVSRGESYDAADPHDALADGSGLPAEEGGGVRRGGHRERWGQVQEGDQNQGQGKPNRVDCSGNWQAFEKVNGTEVLGEGAGAVQPPCRVPTLQSQPVRPLVGVPDVRIRWERFDVDHAASSTATVVPETPDSHSLKTLEGTYPQFLPAPRSKPDQGAVTLKVTNMGKISMVDGGTGSTTSRRSKTSSQETARARSTSKERQMTGLRASQAAKRVPTFNIDREGTMEHLEEAFGPTEVLMISDEEKEWNAGPPHAD